MRQLMQLMQLTRPMQALCRLSTDSAPLQSLLLAAVSDLSLGDPGAHLGPLPALPAFHLSHWQLEQLLRPLLQDHQPGPLQSIGSRLRLTSRWVQSPLPDLRLRRPEAMRRFMPRVPATGLCASVRLS